MKVKMKLREKMAIDYANKFKKNWEHFIIASDGYSSGFRDAMNYISKIEGLKHEYATHLVEVEFKDGEHQIGARFVDKEGKDV